VVRTAAVPRGPSGSWPSGCLRKFHAERGEERQDAAGRNRALEEDTRRLKQGGHAYRSLEAKVCRDPEKEVEILVEKLKKEQASD
jgi:hypothetical protein